MRNYVARGSSMTITAAVDIATGQVVIIGALVGIAVAPIPAGEEGVIGLVGIYRVAKAPSQAWAIGDLIYWDDAAGQATTNDGGGDNPLLGAAARPVDNAATRTFGLVRLSGAIGSGGGGGATVESVNGQTGAVTLTAGDVGAATAAQGALADTAVQPGDLGTAASSDTGDFATAAQGALAGSAVQPGDLAAVATSGDYGDLSGAPTIPTVNFATVSGLSGDWSGTGAATLAAVLADFETRIATLEP